MGASFNFQGQRLGIADNRFFRHADTLTPTSSQREAETSTSPELCDSTSSINVGAAARLSFALVALRFTGWE